MPLIEICALTPSREVDVAGVLRTLNRAVSDALGCRPEAVWTTWRSLDGRYAVGSELATQQPEETHAPIVHLYVNRPREAVERICDVIEDVLCSELALAKGNVFVTVQPVFNAPQ
ncbi:MAG: hypothetical protein ACRDQT_04570 [Gaiellaceae bacterium]